MSFRLWIKTNLADKALASLRSELVSLFDKGDFVVDIGCGSGDLLFKASSKIKSGLGIDMDKEMVSYAQNCCKDKSVLNLEFRLADAQRLDDIPFDIATSTLTFHELDEDVALRVLKQMAKNSKKVIIADYDNAKGFISRVSIELDEMISGHYKRFRAYRRAGGIRAYVQKNNLIIEKTIPSQIDGITIWIIKDRSNK